MRFSPLVMAAGLLAAACGGDAGPPSVTVTGVVLPEPDQTLTLAEDVMRTEARTDGGVIADDAGCWFSYPNADADSAASFLTCGPVLFVDSIQNAPWMTVGMDLSTVDPDIEGADQPKLSILERSSQLTTGDDLRRPDGRDVPDEIALKLPPPPPVAADFIVTGMSKADAALAVTLPNPAVLAVPGWKIELTRAAFDAELGEGPDRLIAPEGHQLLTLEWTAETGYLGYPTTADEDRVIAESRTLALVVDGRRIPLEPNASGSHRRVVPDDADITVELEWKDYLARYSVADGEVDGVDPALTDDAQVTVNKAYSSSLNYEGGGAARTATVSFTIESISRYPWSTTEGSAPEGKQWLFAHITDYDYSTDAYFYDLKVSRLLTITVDGVPVEISEETPRCPRCSPLLPVLIDDDAEQATFIFQPSVEAESRIPSPTSPKAEGVLPDTLTFTVDFATGTTS